MAIGWPAFLSNPESTTTQAAASLPVAPSAPKLLVDLSNVRNFPVNTVRDMLTTLYDEQGGPCALATTLQQLADRFRDVGDGSSLRDLVHRFIGDASAGCAPALVWLARQFQAAPSVQGIASLSHTLVATRAQLQAVGVLPPPDHDSGNSSTTYTEEMGIGATTCHSTVEHSGLVCLGLDSHWSGRAMQTMFFEECLGADMSRSLSMGEGARDEEMFMEVALGRLDGDLQPVPVGEQHHVDVVVVNQYIRNPGPQLEGWDHGRLGSDLAEQLDARGFRGVFCLITALNPEALADVHTLPGVDIALPKSTPHADMAARVLKAVEAKHLWLQTVLNGFLRGALEATNVIADLQQLGGSSFPEALRKLSGLRNAADRLDISAVTAACDAMRSTLEHSGQCDSSRSQQIAALAAVSAAARAAVEVAIDTVNIKELPADLALIQLARQATERAPACGPGNEDAIFDDRRLVRADDPVELAIDESHAWVCT